MARTSETTPLLVVSSENPIAQANAETLDVHKIGNPAEQEQDTTVDEDRPLLMGQIILLCYARLAEPIAFFCIFPIINQMIFEVGGIKEEDVGFYSGLIESLFSLAQMMFMIPWGRTADRFGRKPVLVFSLVGVSIMTSLFGFSKSIPAMILFRCLSVRTMISENCSLKTQARAFSLFSFAGSFGIFIGPVIGGALSTPATQYPRVFGGIWIFENYPYFLPNAVAGLFGLSAAVISFFYLNETLESRHQDANSPAKPTMSTLELAKQPGVPMTLFIWGLVSLQGLANTAVLPVFWFTSVSLGGFGFSPVKISLLLGLAGISQAIWLLFIFPPSQLRFGTGSVLRYCAYIFSLATIVNPLLQFALRQGATTAFWVVLPIYTVLVSSASMSFTCIQLCVNNIAPSPSVLGTMNALSMVIASGIRAIAPGLFASLFATGVRTQILHGYLIWLIMFVMTLITFVTVRYLPEKAEGRIKTRNDHESI